MLNAPIIIAKPAVDLYWIDLYYFALSLEYRLGKIFMRVLANFC